MTRPAHAWTAALCAVVALAAPARAHRLNVEARVEGGRVRVEVYFSDGTAPAGAQVVATRDGVEVARGLTDAAGGWTFAPPLAGRYEVAVTEPGLHRGRVEVEVRAAELAASQPATGAAATGAAATASATAPPASGRRPGGVDWPGVLLGLAIIALLGLGLTVWQRRRAA